MSVYKFNTAKYGTHSLISKEIGENKVVLDIGCNKGYLKQLVPNNVFYGIDNNEEDLEIAKAIYKKVYNLDLQSHYDEFKEDKKFDVIVFADILEHLIFPEIVFRYFLKNFLKNDGSVIVSLSNVAHFSTRIKLLFGKFDYADSGILDKTHLHLYTLTTAKKLMSDAGLKVEKIRFSSNNFGFLIKWIPFLGPFLGFNIILACKKY